MKIKSKTPANERPYDTALKARVLASINKLTHTLDASFEAVRSDASLSNSELPDGWLHQIAIDEDFEVE